MRRLLEAFFVVFVLLCMTACFAERNPAETSASTDLTEFQTDFLESSAASTEDISIPTETLPSETDAMETPVSIAGGYCGSNVKWSLDENGLLTISGMGDMSDYRAARDVPWYNYILSIKTAKIENGVTSIGHIAFFNCSNLKSIIIGKDVNKLATTMVERCSNLQSITVSPDNAVYYSSGNCIIHTATKTVVVGCRGSVIPTDAAVTRIGESAFRQCAGLYEITIPHNITSIGERAFSLCTDLKKVVISGGVTEMGRDVFSGCEGLTDVVLGNGITSLASGLFDGCSSLKNITIPDSVISINASTFDNCLDLIQVEDGVSYVDKWVVGCDENAVSPSLRNDTVGIANRAFADSHQIGIITIPKSVIVIGDCAFYDLRDAEEWGGLEGIFFEEGSKLKIIGEQAFYACNGLEKIIIPDGVEQIGDLAFEKCYRLTSVVIPEGVTSLGSSVFCDCEKLTDVILPNSLISIGERAFENCGIKNLYIGKNVAQIAHGAFGGMDCWFQNNRESIVVAEGNSTYHSSGNCLIETASKTLVLGCKNSVIPVDGSVTAIASHAFRGCSGMTEITIPDCVTDIGMEAFYGCNDLKIIKMPAFSFNELFGIGSEDYDQIPGSIEDLIITSGTSIPAGAFSGAEGLKSVSLPEGIQRIENHAFYGCVKLTSIIIPDSVTSIGDNAFYRCTELKNLTIPSAVVSIGTGALAGIENLTLTVDAGNTVYCSAGNCLIETASKKLIAGWSNSQIPGDGSVTCINDRAFISTKITQIYIPASVTSIGSFAFSDCDRLESITVDPENATFHSVGNCLIETASKTMVAGCKKSVIPTDGSVTVIGEAAFSLCDDLTSISIPASVTRIDIYAFYDCINLTDVTFENHSQLEVIDEQAFYNCVRLVKMQFGGTKAQWNAVSKGKEWYDCAWYIYGDIANRCVVYCNDGNVTL